MAAEANNDAITKYTELHEAGELAAAAGDVPLALKSARKVDTAFIVDVFALKTALLKAAVEAGRLAYLAGRMPKRMYADPSSPLAGLI